MANVSKTNEPLWVMLTFPTQTSLKQSKEIFVTKNVFFLLICLHLNLLSHQEADIYGEKN